MNRNLHFEKANKELKLLVEKWLTKEHVTPYFYGEGLVNTLKNLALYVEGIRTNGDYSFEHFVGFYEGKPFAFLMTSLVAGPHNSEDPYDKWFVEGETTITLDLLIGEKEFLGKGLGKFLIETFLKSCYPTCKYVLIDPEKSNERAIHVYEKAGFKQIEEFVPSFCKKPHIMMRLKRTL